MRAVDIFLQRRLPRNSRILNHQHKWFYTPSNELTLKHIYKRCVQRFCKQIKIIDII